MRERVRERESVSCLSERKYCITNHKTNKDECILLHCVKCAHRTSHVYFFTTCVSPFSFSELGNWASDASAHRAGPVHM